MVNTDRKLFTVPSLGNKNLFSLLPNGLVKVFDNTGKNLLAQRSLKDINTEIPGFSSLPGAVISFKANKDEGIGMPVQTALPTMQNKDDPFAKLRNLPPVNQTFAVPFDVAQASTNNQSAQPLPPFSSPEITQSFGSPADIPLTLPTSPTITNVIGADGVEVSASQDVTRKASVADYLQDGRFLQVLAGLAKGIDQISGNTQGGLGTSLAEAGLANQQSKARTAAQAFLETPGASVSALNGIINNRFGDKLSEQDRLLGLAASALSPAELNSLAQIKIEAARSANDTTRANNDTLTAKAQERVADAQVDNYEANTKARDNQTKIETAEDERAANQQLFQQKVDEVKLDLARQGANIDEFNARTSRIQANASASNAETQRLHVTLLGQQMVAELNSGLSSGLSADGNRQLQANLKRLNGEIRGDLHRLYVGKDPKVLAMLGIAPDKVGVVTEIEKTPLKLSDEAIEALGRQYYKEKYEAMYESFSINTNPNPRAGSGGDFIRPIKVDGVSQNRIVLNDGNVPKALELLNKGTGGNVYVAKNANSNDIMTALRNAGYTANIGARIEYNSAGTHLIYRKR